MVAEGSSMESWESFSKGGVSALCYLKQCREPTRSLSGLKRGGPRVTDGSVTRTNVLTRPVSQQQFEG